MAKTRAVGVDREDFEAQAQQIPLHWRVTKPKAEPVVMAIQTASKATVAVDPIVDVAEYYRDRAASFRKRPKLPRDDDAADGRLF